MFCLNGKDMWPVYFFRAVDTYNRKKPVLKVKILTSFHGEQTNKYTILTFRKFWVIGTMKEVKIDVSIYILHHSISCPGQYSITSMKVGFFDISRKAYRASLP